MNQNVLPSNRAAVVGAIDPDVTTASTVTTGWIAAANFATFMALIMAGTLGTSATFDAKLEQATDGSGSDVKDITGKAITQLTQAGTDESDKQAVINLRADELDVANSFTHFRLSMTVAVATSDLGAVVLGLDPRYGPPTPAATMVEAVA